MPDSRLQLAVFFFAAAEFSAAAGGAELPQAWLDQLAVGGRLVAPVAQDASQGASQVLMVIDKSPRGLRQTRIEAVHIVPLKSGIG